MDRRFDFLISDIILAIHLTLNILPMKKMYFFYLAALSLFFSCKKDKNDDPGSYHITCKVDGVTTSFNSTALAVIGTEEARGLAVNGGVSMSETTDGFGFVIADIDHNVTAGTYTDEGTDYSLLGAYHVGQTDVDYDAGTELRKEAEANNKTITNGFKVIITAIDDKTVKGTFSGDFYPIENLDGDKKTLTEGSFYLPIIKP